MTEYVLLERLRVQNFQSIEDTELELGGLTVLVGPGDAGKSAFLRALRALFLNDAADDDIRHGASQTTVTASFADGMSITWWKEKGKGGCYRVWKGCDEVTEYTKTGGAVPDAVAEYLGIGRIEVDSTTELTPQLSDQHDQPFIIWESGSKRARILGKATRLDVVVTAQMACKKQLDTHRREAERAARELEEVTGQLADLPDVRELTNRLNAIEETYSLVKDAHALAGRARELRDQIAEVHSRARAVDVSRIRRDLQKVPDLLDSAELLIQVEEARSQVARVQWECEKSREVRIAALGMYQEACRKAGVCPVCGGLFDHKECVQ